MTSTTSPRYTRIGQNNNTNVSPPPDYFGPAGDQPISEDYAAAEIPLRNVREDHGAVTSPERAPPRRQSSTTSPSQVQPGSRANTGEIHEERGRKWSKKWSLTSFSNPHLASPWEHPETLGRLPTTYHTERHFHYRGQRLRLFINSTFQFLVTVALCASIAGALVGYSHRTLLQTNQRHVFNAVITGLSLGLGMNLASSLRSYANMFRWRLLATGYRTLREFELIHGCESQTKTLKLLWFSRSHLARFFCILWLLVNVAAQVLVAMIGLTYSVEPSNTFVDTHQGQISIADLRAIVDVNNSTTPTSLTQLAAAQEYGIQGEDYENDGPLPPEAQVFKQTTYTTDDSYSTFLYRFIDWNPSNTLLTLVSTRTVNSTALCSEFTIVGQASGSGSDLTYVDYAGKNHTIHVEETPPGGVTYISDANHTCGPRCSNVMAYQAKDGQNVEKSHFFSCNNTVGLILDDDYDGPSPDTSLPDQQARIFAGAIGWSGFALPNSTLEYQRYSLDTPWAPAGDMDATAVQSNLMQFAMDAVAAFDDHGPRTDISGSTPTQALHVTVEWKWAAPLLGAIPVIQFLTLCVIIIWANKAIIKDDSVLSAARLLRPIVDRLGPHGCMLTAKGIADELKGIRVAYGWRSPSPDSDVKHLDVLIEDEKVPISRSFPEGYYDGEGTGQWDSHLRKRRRRMSM